MKKIGVILVLILLAAVFVPVPTECFEDGTKVYESLTYAVVEWHANDGTYENTRLYWFPERGIDNLLKLEADLRNAE